VQDRRRWVFRPYAQVSNENHLTDRAVKTAKQGLSFGTYSRPAMLRLAEVVEQIRYAGVKL
jgi:hypothetical protein